MTGPETEKESEMRNTRTGWAAAAGLLLAVLAAGPAYAGQDFLSGKVRYLDQGGQSLKTKMETASRDFRSGFDGDLFFTGYVFLSRHSIRMGERHERSATAYKVKVSSDRIRVRRENWRKSGTSFHTEDDEPGPAGLLLLHRVDGKHSKLIDAHLLDLDDTYTFEDRPVFWMGEAKNPESLSLLTGAFESGGQKLQDRLLFVIGSHVDPEAGEFLRRAALGDYPHKTRKSAIFWIGNLKDDRSLGYLKEIYGKVRDDKLQEQVVFALHICDDEGAVPEMIRIARSDAGRKVRKSAVFWLGQKASEESARFLKGVVDSGDDDDIKDAAVFAISQLPKDRSVPMLIDIAKSNKSASVRKKAIFWLGQTGTEEALRFFEDILLTKKR